MKELQKNELTAKYCLNVLNLKKTGNDIDRLGNTLANSKIDLTPHQLQASLFAFKSPLTKGVILADEVGLGKTIEAGIVIAQNWFEKKGKTLVITPATLLKQWQSELLDKFGFNSTILDRKEYKLLSSKGYIDPINHIETSVVLCSYQMCSSFKDEIKKCHFDLVVIDEAHKLRNVHNEKAITANNIKDAISSFKKVLLTATPIQNSLLDLYGLSTIIDDNLFGDKDIFKYNYINNYSENVDELEKRLKNILHRTLRKQVNQYIQFTNRIPKTYLFELTESEKEVYSRIRDLLLSSENDSYLIPKAQKHLIVLILCKLMGSSMSAISSTLEKMRQRLINLRDKKLETSNNELIDDFEIEEELEEETEGIEEVDVNRINAEINNLSKIIELASSAKNESKYNALKESLDYSFKHLKEIGAEEKVLIFTESKRTQEYLYESLLNDGCEGVLTYNGSNNDDKSKEIFNDWIEKHPNIQKNSKSILMREAILNKFKESGKILISTEAGAEGLNLQFCSLVINYDLPWNPQRVEQRIGRCHRFGQKHDVVVINFISKDNAIEQRIYELLNNKFNLFNEILGSSDTILGNIEDGKDIERSIIDIYKNCRTEQEIQNAFDNIQNIYKDEISQSLRKTKENLLNYFEEDLQQYFKEILDGAEKSVSEIEKTIWKLLMSLWLSNIEMIDDCSFKKDGISYRLISKNQDSNNYNDFGLGTDLGKKLLDEANRINRKNGHINFDITNYPYKISRIEKIKGNTGYITLKKVRIDSFEKEECLIFNGILEDGTRLEQDVCEMLFRLNTKEYEKEIESNTLTYDLEKDSDINVKSAITKIQIRNNEYLTGEIEKINSWADDKILSIQLDVENMRAYRKELQIKSDLAANMEEKERIEKEILQISKKIKNSWLELANAEDEVEIERKKMIESIKREMQKETTVEDIFTISFSVV